MLWVAIFPVVQKPQTPGLWATSGVSQAVPIAIAILAGILPEAQREAQRVKAATRFTG